MLNVQDLTRKVLNDEEVSSEEYAVVIESLRLARTAGASKKAIAAKAVEELDLDKLFD